MLRARNPRRKEILPLPADRVRVIPQRHRDAKNKISDSAKPFLSRTFSNILAREQNLDHGELVDCVRRLEAEIEANNGSWDGIVQGGHPFGGLIQRLVGPVFGPASAGVGKLLLHSLDEEFEHVLDNVNTVMQFGVVYYSLLGILGIERSLGKRPDVSSKPVFMQILEGLGICCWTLLGPFCLIGVLFSVHAVIIVKAHPLSRRAHLIFEKPRLLSAGYSLGPPTLSSLFLALAADFLNNALLNKKDSATFGIMMAALVVSSVGLLVAWVLLSLALAETARPWEYAGELLLKNIEPGSPVSPARQRCDSKRDVIPLGVVPGSPVRYPLPTNVSVE